MQEGRPSLSLITVSHSKGALQCSWTVCLLALPSEERPVNVLIMSLRTKQYFISPTFTHEKLESPSYDDLIDVFEDRTRNWLLLPASKLLDMPHCEIAAVGLLVNYFEGIEIYVTGEDSKRQSEEFFARGFGRVFSAEGHDPSFSRKIAAAIYSQARCGFAHDGMFRNRVFFNRVRPEPILVSWLKKNGVFDQSREVESISINPSRFYESIETHFNRYVKTLREAVDAEAKSAFKNAVALKWGLDEPDRVIGMTEDEFFKT